MAGGGGQGIVSRVASLGQQNAPAPTGAQFTPVTPNVYQSPFSSIQGAVQPTEQLAVMPTGGLGGLKAGVAPNSSNISPMPTMTHDLVQPDGAPVPMPIMGDTAPRFEGPRTGGPGIGPPPEMVQQPAPILSPAIGMEPRNMPMQQPAPMQQRMQMQQPMFRQPMMMPQYGGLQSLFNAMMMQQRMQPMRMPMYQSPALAFRPNIQQAQQNLSRVKPSVYQSELDAARARIAELEGQRGGE